MMQQLLHHWIQFQIYEEINYFSKLVLRFCSKTLKAIVLGGTPILGKQVCVGAAEGPCSMPAPSGKDALKVGWAVVEVHINRKVLCHAGRQHS